MLRAMPMSCRVLVGCSHSAHSDGHRVYSHTQPTGGRKGYYKLLFNGHHWVHAIKTHSCKLSDWGEQIATWEWKVSICLLTSHTDGIFAFSGRELLVSPLFCQIWTAAICCNCDEMRMSCFGGVLPRWTFGQWENSNPLPIGGWKN